MTADIRRLRRKLLTWYRAHKRDTPWRRRPDFYHTIVAEFMLQQTRVDQALPYYRRFMKRFPSMTALAAASEREVLKSWEGLGYYHRAHRLHAIARAFAGRRPRFEELESQPGIGRYTLAALGSIIYGKAMPVLDGNVRRVAARMLALNLPAESTAAEQIIRGHLEQWIAPDAPAAFNQALMELGATVCRPGKPLCTKCPWREMCAGRRTGHPESFPVRTASPAKPRRQIAAAVIHRKGRILITQRPATGLLPNLWEFPGGKQERGETLAACCAREIREELDIEIEVGSKVARVQHAYSHYSVTLHFFDCEFVSGRPRALGCQDFQWVRPKELAGFPFPRANWDVVSRISGRPYPEG